MLGSARNSAPAAGVAHQHEPASIQCMHDVVFWALNEPQPGASAAAEQVTGSVYLGRL